MTSPSERAVVFIRLHGMDYVPAGLLRHEDRAYFFRYGRRYLGRPDAIPLDPARMPLADMEFSGRTLFSALRDAAPDRWGRKVLGLMAGRALWFRIGRPRISGRSALIPPGPGT